MGVQFSYKRTSIQARVGYLDSEYGSRPDERYTDASPYPNRTAHALTVVDSKGSILSSLTLKTANIDAAEEAAIALPSHTDPE